MIRKLAQLPIHAYRWCISPFLPPMCRFQPTCSQYALDALTHHGIFRGSYLTLRRLLRCHPWGGSGFDPVPSCRDKGCTSKATDLNSQHMHFIGHHDTSAAS